MFFGLGNWFFCKAINALSWMAVAVNCPKCGHRGKPFPGHRFTHYSEFMGRFPCPKCGHYFAIGEDARTASLEGKFNPPGPHPQPADSRIERRTPSEHELLFYVPPSGSSGGLIAFAILWNAVIIPLFINLLFFGDRHGERLTGVPRVMLCTFLAAGLVLAYAALRQRYASHLLYLSPELIRMQRRFIFKASFSLVPAAVMHVKKVLFYAHNRAPVYGIEINAGMRQIRFGSALREEEKDWLAWEIRDFLRQHGAVLLPREGKRKRPPDSVLPPPLPESPALG